MTDDNLVEIICPYCQCGLKWQEIYVYIDLPINDGETQGTTCPKCEKDFNVICWEAARFELDNDQTRARRNYELD